MKRKTVHTGIYSHEEYTIESFHDLMTITKRLALDHHMMQKPGPWLDAIEREAKAVQVDPVSDRQAKDLVEILALVARVRRYIESGDVDRVATHAIRLGMMVERAKVRRAEPRALRPLERTKELVDSAKKRGRSSEEKKKALRRYREILEAEPGIKKETARKRVHQETNVAPRSLRRYEKEDDEGRSEKPLVTL